MTSEREFLDALSAPLKLVIENLRVMDRLIVDRFNQPRPVDDDLAEPAIVGSAIRVPTRPTPGAPAVHESNFVFGTASERELVGVEPQLVLVARRALIRSTQDFCVFDGIRSYKEQQQHVANGTSKTMKSKHLEGLAVDLVPWINGKPTWDWEGCYLIALAMDQAATELGTANRITWGGVWDRTLADFGGSANEYRKAVDEYKARHPGKDFIDGPHFEWRK